MNPSARILIAASILCLSPGAWASDIKPASPGDKDYALPASKDEELIGLWKQQNHTLRLLELPGICGRTSGRVAPFIASLLESDSSEEMRGAGARVLGRCGDAPVALPALRKATKDKSDTVQRLAADSLVRRKDFETALPVYLKQVQRGNWVSTWEATRRLRDFEPQSDFHRKFSNQLLSIKKDASAEHWRRALAALGATSAGLDLFDEQTADLIRASLEKDSRLTDSDSVMKVKRILFWIDGIERNRNPNQITRSRMARAIEPVLSSSVNETRNQAKDALENLSK